jgi:hypothetical protein
VPAWWVGEKVLMPRMLVIGWEQGCSCSCTTRMLGAALALEKAQVLGSVFFKCAQAGDARSVIIESPVPLWMNATRRPPAGRGGAGSYSDIRSRARRVRRPGRAVLGGARRDRMSEFRFHNSTTP